MRGPSRGFSNINRNRKLAGGLLAAAVAAGTAYAVPTSADAASPSVGGQLTPLETGAGSPLRTADGRLVVDVRFSSYDASRVQGVKAAGADVVHRSPALRQVTVAVAPDDLAAVSDAPGVEYVGQELTPQVSATCDTTISAGDTILKANQLRATGVDGTGVKVGVLSDSYDKAAGAATHAAGDIATDNLPGAANTCGHTSVSAVEEPVGAGADEGRAMMQIVHDLAPGSPLDFATAFDSEPDFADNIRQLASQGAKVIVDDVTYFDEPMYQDGIVEQAVTQVRGMGVDYFSSSANNRMVKNGHEVGSYEAVNGYRPTTCPAIITGHADCHNFGTAGAPDATFGYTPANGQTIRAILNWAEPWFGVNTDYDLYLIDQTTNTVLTTAGATVNAGGAGSQKTFEGIAGTQSTGGGETWAFVVARKSGAAPATTPRFKLLFAENGAQPFISLEREVPDAGTGDVMGPTAFGHNGGADAMSVGASDVRVATNLNSYSSYGPVTTLFGPVVGTSPAAPLGPPRVLNKPDIVASDCNLTTFFAGASHVFCGTSAAAPHAAAVAALLRQKFPTATTTAINNAMISTASPIAGVPGSFQGGGLINALAAAGALTPPPPTTPDTILTKFPKHTVKTTRSTAKVSFQFTSTVAGSTFACSIDGKAFAPCASGVTFKLKPGKHTFAVRATAGGVTDPTPATYSFKVKRKKHHH
jgi:Subtilase family